MTNTVLCKIDDRGVATVTLNRPDVHNAFNEDMINGLDNTFADLGDDPSVRAILLRGAGKSFSAGADIDWMRRAADFSVDENREDAMKLSGMLHRLNSCPKPTVAAVHGAAMGGGVGLVSCVDIAIAVRDTKFSLSEVRLGLTPATISPYVIAKIGTGQARRLFVSAERFDGKMARKIGLIHKTVGSVDDMEQELTKILRDILLGAPGAQADAKTLIRDVAYQPITDDLRAQTAERIAQRRASEEGREGLGAFLEKRPASWTPKS